MNLKAAIDGVEWNITQEAKDTMVALASTDNEPVALKTEIVGGTYVMHIAGPIVHDHDLFSIMFGATSSMDIIAGIAEGQKSHQEIEMHIDSGGGQVKGGERVVEAIRSCAIPISAIVDGVCASQAFLYASSVLDPQKPSNRFVASDESRLGSIGVQAVMYEDPNEKVIKSKNAPLKNSVESVQKSVNDSEDILLDQLAENFSRPKQEIIDNFGQGLVFTAAEALERRMIQGIAQPPAAPAASTTTTGNQMTTESNTGAENTVTVEKAEADKNAAVTAALEKFKADQQAAADQAETERLRAETVATARKTKLTEYAQANKKTEAAKLFLDPEQKAFFAMDADTAIASLSIAAEDVKAKPKATDAMASTDPDIEFSGDEQEFAASGGDGNSELSANYQAVLHNLTIDTGDADLAASLIASAQKNLKEFGEQKTQEKE